MGDQIRTLHRSQIKGKHGLAVTSARRSPAVPNVPTLAELGYPELRDLDVNSWVGMVAPHERRRP